MKGRERTEDIARLIDIVLDGLQAWMPLAALPIIVLGTLLAVRRKRGGWGWHLLADAWLVLLAMLLIYTAVAWIGSLYQYEAL